MQNREKSIVLDRPVTPKYIYSIGVELAALFRSSQGSEANLWLTRSAGKLQTILEARMHPVFWRFKMCTQKIINFDNTNTNSSYIFPQKLVYNK